MHFPFHYLSLCVNSSFKVQDSCLNGKCPHIISHFLIYSCLGNVQIRQLRCITLHVSQMKKYHLFSKDNTLKMFQISSTDYFILICFLLIGDIFCIISFILCRVCIVHWWFNCHVQNLNYTTKLWTLFIIINNGKTL